MEPTIDIIWPNKMPLLAEIKLKLYIHTYIEKKRKWKKLTKLDWWKHKERKEEKMSKVVEPYINHYSLIVCTEDNIYIYIYKFIFVLEEKDSRWREKGNEKSLLSLIDGNTKEEKKGKYWKWWSLISIFIELDRPYRRQWYYWPALYIQYMNFL